MRCVIPPSNELVALDRPMITVRYNLDISVWRLLEVLGKLEQVVV